MTVPPPHPPRESVAVLTGTTASGKTTLALRFARIRRMRDIEIINADSLLVFRGMDIGTAKPTRAELAEVPHHLIDIRAPNEAFTAGDFLREALAAIDAIHARGKRALVVGGSGFYLKALLFGIWEAPPASSELRNRLRSSGHEALYQELRAVDPVFAAKIGARDPYRTVRALEVWHGTGVRPSELEAKQRVKQQSEGLRPGFHLIFVDREKKDLEDRIAARTREMLDRGLIEETRSLIERFPGAKPLASVGYAETARYLGEDGGLRARGRAIRPGLDGLREEVDLATRQLVKRQRTWFKGQFSKFDRVTARTLDRDAQLVEETLAEIYG